MKTLKSLKELKSLKGQLVAQANSKTVKHSSYSFKDKNGVHFIPAAEINSEVQTLEGPKIGGFNSSRLPDYLKNGYTYSQQRKFEIHKQIHSRKNWSKLSEDMKELNEDWDATNILANLITKYKQRAKTIKGVVDIY